MLFACAVAGAGAGADARAGARAGAFASAVCLSILFPRLFLCPSIQVTEPSLQSAISVKLQLTIN